MYSIGTFIEKLLQANMFNIFQFKNMQTTIKAQTYSLTYAVFCQ